jgi:HK97 family phage portal protein
MGVLARRVEEVRGSVSDWYTRDDHDDGPSSTAGVRVNSRVALGLTTVWRCVDLLTSAVSQAPKDVTLKVGGQSFQQFQKPGWLVLPNPADPTYTINDYFAQISISLLIEGNYFTYVVGSVHFPLALIPLPPSRVRVIKGLRYEILDQNGQVSKTVGPDEMLHGTWMRPPGELRGISPLENLRRSIGSAVAAEEYAGRYFAQGATLSFGVEVPYPMDPVKQREFKEKLREGMSGRTNQHVIGVLTDNAKFITGLAPTPEQAQMLDTRKWGVEDLCRPYGVPPAMAGSQEAGAASFASTDTYDRWFKERGVQPLASRLE